jgi:hypothetical protein
VARARQLAEWGVSTLFTDDPAVVCAALRQRLDQKKD